MKEIQFDEKQLGDIQTIGEMLFSGDSSDPRSWAYKRELIRPSIKWWRIAVFVLLLMLGDFGIYFLLSKLSVPSGIALCVCVLCVVTVLLLFLKRILICIVRIYQRYAPKSVRNKCRFEPSCSQYMILSLEKYGAFKGLKKGIDRLKRCNRAGGGFDYP